MNTETALDDLRTHCLTVLTRPIHKREELPSTPALIRRLDAEIDIIANRGFVPAFAAMKELGELCREEQIPVRLRGAAGSSVILFALGFTGINPLRAGLFFERFVGPRRSPNNDSYLTLETSSHSLKRVRELLLPHSIPERGLRIGVFDRRHLELFEHVQQQVRTNRGVRLNLHDLPIDDPAVYDQFRRANLAGVHGCESEGFRKLLIQIGPSKLEHLAAAVALYRPGPIEAGLLKDYVAAKERNQPKIHRQPCH